MRRKIPTKTMHGLTGSPEYRCWQSIRRRCLNKNHTYYKYYGGRGIKISPKWLEDFPVFLSDIGTRPSNKHTLDRYPNNNGNYEPGNVRWATRKEQVDNRRTTRNVKIDGILRPVSDVCRELGINPKVVSGRIDRGWTPERAILTPPLWSRPDLSREK